MAAMTVLISVINNGIKMIQQRHAAILPHVKHKVYCFLEPDFIKPQSLVFLGGTSTSCCAVPEAEKRQNKVQTSWGHVIYLYYIL